MERYKEEIHQSMCELTDDRGKGSLFPGKLNTPTHTPKTICKWNPPPVGIWKLNTDASFVGKSEDTCLGTVVRDHRGDVVLSVCRKIKASAGPEEAEAEAIKLGMSELSSLYQGKLIIESDCLTMVNRLKAEGVDKSQLHHIVQDIRDQMGLFESVSWSATKREGNQLAHSLAAWARKNGGCRVIAGVPSQLVDLSLSECNPV